MLKGGQVVAVVQIVEEGFSEEPVNGTTDHVHAEQGERGEVVDVVDGWIMVRWNRTDTIATCDPEEVAEVCPKCHEVIEHHPLCVNRPTYTATSA